MLVKAGEETYTLRSPRVVRMSGSMSRAGLFCLAFGLLASAWAETGPAYAPAPAPAPPPCVATTSGCVPPLPANTTGEDVSSCPSTPPCATPAGALCSLSSHDNEYTTSHGVCGSSYKISCPSSGASYTILVKYAQTGSQYIGMLDAFRLPSGPVQHSRVYQRTGVRSDSCACLCEILLPSMPSDCECV
ncbi:hypothetical protein WJX81_003750 [Elliptochloris bilobata]|uniref:Uncharacterized protein n=1 Tax=Elliptochloris bilobata TaxID=381761 RepID=A0AAW1RLW6_9CHLO